MAGKNPFKKKPKTDFKDVDKLSKKEAKEEIDQLREAIEYHNHKYYVENDPEISDKKFDTLFNRLVELEDAFPDYESGNSPTKRVGASPADKLKKVKHKSPMLSLNAVNKFEEVKDFIDRAKKGTDKKRLTFYGEPKLDGLSVEIYYENGEFNYGATRGDGREGEDISKNLRTINTVPLRLKDSKDLPDKLAVRGEVLMTRSGFTELNKKKVEKGDEPFANPRNAAAGIVRQLDSKKVADKPLEVYFYDIIDSSDSIDSHESMLKKFKKWGLRVNGDYKKCTSIDDIKKYHENFIDKREDLEIEIDGVVLKLNDYELRKKLGTRERSPRWAVAWKFQPIEKVTKLEEIVVQVGRTGMLTPVALLQPVDVEGVTVSRATLHNEDEVHKKDVRPGDKVKVKRAGDVIPEIEKRVKTPGKKRSNKFHMPKKCPVCETEVIKEGAYYFCPNGLSCQAQLIGELVHFTSRDALNIEHIGEKIARQMVEKGMVEDLADLYYLKKDDLLELEGFAEKSAENLYGAIQDSKNPRLDKFLYALGIRHVGEHIARVLAQKYEKLEKVKKASKKELLQINEIGDEIAESIASFFGEKSNIKTIDRMLDAGVKVEELETRDENILEGKTIVFTGELENYSRSEAKDIVESLGGRATSSVSSNTDYVVAGEDPGSKYDDAKKENVRILDEKEFEKLKEGKL